MSPWLRHPNDSYDPLTVYGKKILDIEPSAEDARDLDDPRDWPLFEYLILSGNVPSDRIGAVMDARPGFSAWFAGRCKQRRENNKPVAQRLETKGGNL